MVAVRARTVSTNRALGHRVATRRYSANLSILPGMLGSLLTTRSLDSSVALCLLMRGTASRTGMVTRDHFGDWFKI